MAWCIVKHRIRLNGMVLSLLNIWVVDMFVTLLYNMHEREYFSDGNFVSIMGLFSVDS
jgi:hypothetical protein